MSWDQERRLQSPNTSAPGIDSSVPTGSALLCRSMQLPESYQIGRERVQDDAIGGHLGDGPLNEADSRAEAEGRAMRIEGREPCVVSHRELEDAAAAVLPVVVEEHPEYPCA